MPKIDISAAKAKANELFAGFTSGQKTMLILAAVGTIVGGMLFMRMGSGTQYAPLYSNLTAESASEVTAALDGAGVPYELADGGSTIRVPRSEVYTARLDLSAEGLPRDGAPGYDLLDEQGITTSEFRQRVDYQRAMEGELSRTIRAINGVDGAIVHLVMPEDDLFSGDAQHPSASVLVSTDPNSPLTSGQVQAVVHLVASSIEGLQAEHVTVADNSGRVLSTTGPDGAIAATSDVRSSQTAQFESDLAARIQDMILPVAGVGRSRVVVNADLDFDRRSTTMESFGEPGTAPVVQESVSTETFEGTGGGQVGGVLGPDGVPIVGGADGNNYQRENADRVYANEKITEVVENAPGDVLRLNVAVLLDEGAGVDARAIEQLVQRGAGIDPERGDGIEVTQLPFDTSAADRAAEELEAARSAEAQGQLFSLLRTVASVLIVAIVLFLAWRSHRKAAIARYPVELPVADPDDRGLPSGSDDDEDTISMGELEAQLDALHPGGDPHDEQREALQGQVADLIDRQPEEVASVLRTWMAER